MNHQPSPIASPLAPGNGAHRPRLLVVEPARLDQLVARGDGDEVKERHLGSLVGQGSWRGQVLSGAGESVLGPVLLQKLCDLLAVESRGKGQRSQALVVFGIHVAPFLNE